MLTAKLPNLTIRAGHKCEGSNNIYMKLSHPQLFNLFNLSPERLRNRFQRVKSLKKLYLVKQVVLTSYINKLNCKRSEFQIRIIYKYRLFLKYNMVCSAFCTKQIAKKFEFIIIFLLKVVYEQEQDKITDI